MFLNLFSKVDVTGGGSYHNFLSHKVRKEMAQKNQFVGVSLVRRTSVVTRGVKDMPADTTASLKMKDNETLSERW